jgi:2-methylisocitrate lyase-like PEP mutase family enzyme
VATTSSGFAATLGRLDGAMTREEALGHAAQIAQATDLSVSADLENGFVDEPEGVAETVRLAAEAGLAGCSVEDFSGRARTLEPWGEATAQDEASRNPSEPTASRRNAAGYVNEYQ